MQHIYLKIYVRWNHIHEKACDLCLLDLGTSLGTIISNSILLQILSIFL